jgi:hypothetical protein
VVEGVQSILGNRERANARDTMQRLGAAHHHFLLRQLLTPLRDNFQDVEICWVRTTLFQRLFGRVKLSSFGCAIDECWAHFPRAMRAPAISMSGGTVIVACRRPKALRPSTESPLEQSLTDYPVDLAQMLPISETVITDIREMLFASQRPAS